MDTEMPYKLMFKAICKYHAWKERLHFKVTSFIHLISDIDFVIDFQKCYMNNRNIKCYISFKFTQNIFKKQLYINLDFDWMALKIWGSKIHDLPFRISFTTKDDVSVYWQLYTVFFLLSYPKSKWTFAIIWCLPSFVNLFIF